jgi:hypothetical protein
MQANGAFIKWATATETNTSHYEPEHSTDGMNYFKAGTVTAAGNSSNETLYNFLHTAPVDGINYYRIRQVDKDGRFTYSAVIKLVRTTAHHSITIAPNPAQHFILLRINEVKPVDLKVFDMNGRLVQQQQLPGGRQQHNINIEKIPAGVYQLQIQTSTGITTASFVKQ